MRPAHPGRRAAARSLTCDEARMSILRGTRSTRQRASGPGPDVTPDVSPERRSLLKWAMMSGGAALASLSRTLPADAATTAREERAQGEVERATRGMPAPRIKDLKRDRGRRRRHQRLHRRQGHDRSGRAVRLRVRYGHVPGRAREARAPAVTNTSSPWSPAAPPTGSSRSGSCAT